MLADELAAVGFCVIRFDYDGTGDSAGGASDARLAAWTATARSAIELLRRNAASDICMVGMRFGALFAASSAGQAGEVDQLVLWDPCNSGRSFLAEERALARLTRGAQPVNLEEGAVEAPGVIYSAAMAAEIGGLSIDTLSRPLSRRVLVLERDDRARPDNLYGGDFARETLTRTEAVGQLELMDYDAPNQELPFSSIRRIVDWLSEGAGTRLRSVSLPEAGGATVVDGGAGGQTAIETPVTVPPAGLFGILTEPSTGQSPTAAPLALMLTGGTEHHVGPGRGWVDLSRRWACAGIRSLRLDLSGLGDSPFRPSNRGQQWTPCKADAFDDILDVTRWACPDDPTNVVFVGLCGSGYQAFESGLNLQARGIVAINPNISFVPPERLEGAPIDPRRVVLLPQDDVIPAFRKGGRFGGLRERYPNLAWRARLLLYPGLRSSKWLRRLVKQGTDTLIVYGDDEIRPILRGVSAAGMRRLRRSGLLRLEHMAGLDHALSIADQRELAFEIVTEHVFSRFLPDDMDRTLPE